ncbi:UDP-glucuronosyl/UDP-glucosyltransferase [Dillenia turbinata]|uniref:UDP-glucuronosyl/UDP-glucosyltransferase n=1 Tax=Dillenia turbinata TaxID=194707 RepID=A0AAN8V8N1_9MAGN
MAEEGKLHIVLLPWFAFGHMIPFLELSKLLAQKGHKVSFVASPRNINRLPKTPPSFFPKLNFVEISLPHTEGLPENAEATADLPLDKIQYLKKAYDGLQQPLTRFLETSKPNWIILDFASYWLPPIAANLNISTAYFSVFTAPSHCFFGGSEHAFDRTEPEHYTVTPKWIPFPTSIRFRHYEILRLSDGFSENASGVSDLTRSFMTFDGCDLIALRSSFEFETEWLNLLQQLQRKPVIPVGFLPKKIDNDKEDADDTKSNSWKVIKKWLDKQVKESVLYIAFGSESTLSHAESTALAHGLEQSELPFLWALRNGKLPEGFEDRIRPRGLIWTSWAPQLRILSHDSVGGFLNHCGVSSVFEAIQMKKPMILLPLFLDQGLICRVLEEKKLGYPIPRDELDGSFTSESVAESVKLVMGEEEGKMYREKVKEMSGHFADHELQDRYINQFINHLQHHGCRLP